MNTKKDYSIHIRRLNLFVFIGITMELQYDIYRYGITNQAVESFWRTIKGGHFYRKDIIQVTSHNQH